MKTSRRHFVAAAGRTLAAVGVGGVVAGTKGIALAAEAKTMPPVAVFSKVYQQLDLDFEQSAEITAAAGLEGIDCPVRPGGQILPERAADHIPQYAEALGKRGLRMLLLSTAIQDVSTPHARHILDAAKRLGIRYYRLGFWNHRPDLPPERLYAQIRAGLTDLAALNRQLGLCALIQNHSSPDAKTAIVGGDLDELYRIVEGFHPDQIAVTFDLGHAIMTHGDQWRARFEKLKKYVRIVSVKDMQRPWSFVAFGEGEFRETGFFPALAKTNYREPISMHIEYEWAPDGKKTRALLLETLKHSRRVLGQWWQGDPK